MSRRYQPKNKSLPTKFSAGFIAKLDGRQELTKRLGFALSSVVEDCGGPDALPYAKRALCERFCWLEEFLRQIEIELVKGVVDRADLLGKWVQGVNSMNGLCKVLGIAERQNAIDALYSDPDGPDESPQETPTLPPVASNGEGRGKIPQRRERLLNAKPGDRGGEDDEDV